MSAWSNLELLIEIQENDINTLRQKKVSCENQCAALHNRAKKLLHEHKKDNTYARKHNIGLETLPLLNQKFLETQQLIKNRLEILEKDIEILNQKLFETFQEKKKLEILVERKKKSYYTYQEKKEQKDLEETALARYKKSQTTL